MSNQVKIEKNTVQVSDIDVSTNFYPEDPERLLFPRSDCFARVQRKGMFACCIKSDKRFGIFCRPAAPYADKKGLFRLDMIDFKED